MISDAGTPTISDPGLVLIKECIKNNLKIFPIPGVSAATTAISVSGLSDQYFFMVFYQKNRQLLKKNLKN